MTAPLLVLWHSRTGTAEALALAVAEGAGATSRLLPAADAGPDDLLAAQAYVFVAPENLASLSGMMKEMFDRCYYPLLGKLEGRGYASIIAAGSDGAGAERQLDRIVTGWRLRRVAEPWIFVTGAQEPEAILARKTLDVGALGRAHDLGKSLAEGLELGIF